MDVTGKPEIDEILVDSVHSEVEAMDSSVRLVQMQLEKLFDGVQHSSVIASSSVCGSSVDEERCVVCHVMGLPKEQRRQVFRSIVANNSDTFMIRFLRFIRSDRLIGQRYSMAMVDLLTIFGNPVDQQNSHANGTEQQAAKSRAYSRLAMALVDLFLKSDDQLLKSEKRFITSLAMKIIPKIEQPAAVLEKYLVKRFYGDNTTLAVLTVKPLFCLMTSYGLVIHCYYNRLRQLLGPMLANASQWKSLLHIVELSLQSLCLSNQMRREFAEELAKLCVMGGLYPTQIISVLGLIEQLQSDEDEVVEPLQWSRKRLLYNTLLHHYDWSVSSTCAKKLNYVERAAVDKKAVVPSKSDQTTRSKLQGSFLNYRRIETSDNFFSFTDQSK